MTKLINKFICLCRGHEWEETCNRIFHSRNGVKWHYIDNKCARCGRIKEEVT